MNKKEKFLSFIKAQPLDWLQHEIEKPNTYDEWEIDEIIREIKIRMLCPVCNYELTREHFVDGEELATYGITLWTCTKCKRWYEEDRFGKMLHTSKDRILKKIRTTKALEREMLIEKKLAVDAKVFCSDCNKSYTLKRELVNFLEDDLSRKYSSSQVDIFWNLCELCRKKLFGTNAKELVLLAIARKEVDYAKARTFNIL